MQLRAALALLIAMTSSALGSDGFDLGIPGRPGVPVSINGIDVSYAIVEGTFGLGKDIQFQPTIYGGRYVDYAPNVGHYNPSSGHAPGYGRLEIEPPANRKLPQPAERYFQSWSEQSAQQPAQSDVPLNPPPIIYAPYGDGMPQNFNCKLDVFRPRTP